MMTLFVEHHWILPLLAVFACALALLMSLLLAQYALAFLQVCYSISFLPVASAVLSEQVVFWNASIFEYESRSVVVQYMALIWLLSSIAFALAQCMAFRALGQSAPAFQPGIASVRADIGFWNTALVYLAGCVLIGLRIATAGTISELLPGFEFLLYLTLLFAWSIALVGADTRLTAGALLMTTFFILSQAATGDRDFVVVIGALAVIYLVRHRTSFGRLAGIFALSLVVVVFGAVLSIVRMDIDYSFEELLVYLRFNSWNAIILPVVQLVENEWDTGEWLMGRSYLDVLLSLPPSPLFALLGMEKPIVTDNPALWYYVQGLGGIHISGLAYRNFGLVGVFVQAWILAYGLCRVQRWYQSRPTIWPTFLMLTLCGVVMHTLWYGLIHLAHALVSFGAIFVLVQLLRSFWHGLGEVAVRRGVAA